MNHTDTTTQCEEEYANLGKVMSRIFVFLSLFFLFVQQIKYVNPEYEKYFWFRRLPIWNVVLVIQQQN